MTSRAATAMHPGKAEPVAIAILAKAPVAGLAKTRLIPALGAHGAAALQERMTELAVAKAVGADTGPVTLWAAPDATHPSFRALVATHRITLRRQPETNLGERMLAACADVDGPVLVIGTDCPAMSVAHLRAAADALRRGSDVTIVPAEDGGYVLIGMRKPQPGLFDGIIWGGSSVMSETRARVEKLKLTPHEFAPLCDIDRPDDIERLRSDPAFVGFF